MKAASQEEIEDAHTPINHDNSITLKDTKISVANETKQSVYNSVE